MFGEKDGDSEQFSDTLLKTLPFGIDIVDKEGNILYLNEVFKKALGEGAVGRKCWLMYKDDKEQCSRCPLINGVNIGETAVVETEGVLGGKILQIHHTGLEYKGKEAILEVFVDISDLKKQGKTIEQRNEELEKALDDLYLFRTNLIRDMDAGTLDSENERIKELLNKIEKSKNT